MRFSVFLVTAAATAQLVSAGTCTVSSISACSKKIQSTKTRTNYLTSWCSSVLGCTKTTTTIPPGATITKTSTKIITSTYSWEVIETETTTTDSFTNTETEYTEVATETWQATRTVERFAITTVGPKRRDVDDALAHPRDLLKRATTSICSPAVEKKACSCLIGGCAPPITKDLRKTILRIETETSYVLVEVPITYTNTEWEGSFTTTTQPYTWLETLGSLSTHTTTIKCTPGASSATSFFKLQATNAPSVNKKYWWAAPTNPRLLSFSIEVTFTSDNLAATVFSLDSVGRLITRHLNGTQYVNIDHYGGFQLVHHIDRREIQRRGYNYLKCSFQPASGRFAGNYRELYCVSDGDYPQPIDIWNYCPQYAEWFNAPVVLGTEFSAESPDCEPLVWLIKPVCDW